MKGFIVYVSQILKFWYQIRTWQFRWCISDATSIKMLYLVEFKRVAKATLKILVNTRSQLRKTRIWTNLVVFLLGLVTRNSLACCASVLMRCGGGITWKQLMTSEKFEVFRVFGYVVIVVHTKNHLDRNNWRGRGQLFYGLSPLFRLFLLSLLGITSDWCLCFRPRGLGRG